MQICHMRYFWKSKCGSIVRRFVGKPIRIDRFLSPHIFMVLLRVKKRNILKSLIKESPYLEILMINKNEMALVEAYRKLSDELKVTLLEFAIRLPDDSYFYASSVGDDNNDGSNFVDLGASVPAFSMNFLPSTVADR